jgi:hypothetical protein
LRHPPFAQDEGRWNVGGCEALPPARRVSANPGSIVRSIAGSNQSVPSRSAAGRQSIANLSIEGEGSATPAEVMRVFQW